jgi:predicted ribosome quality control (RQC) complex YloA/Tae2 family protein
LISQKKEGFFRANKAGYTEGVMIFDSLILTAVRDELGRTLVGGKIEKITQPDPLEIVLRFYHAGHKHDLLLSCDPVNARAHLTFARRDNPPTPPPFCSVLRKYLDGAWLSDISLPLGFGERVLHLHFKAVDGAPYTLIAEIMGKHSNLIFVNGAGMILGAAKNIGRTINRLRQIQPGLNYAPPPRQRGRHDPLLPLVTDLGTEPLESDKAKEWLMANWSGVSPLLASETVARISGLLTPQTLHHALTVLLTVVRVGDWSPRVWTDDAGKMLGAYPLVLQTVPLANQHSRESVSVALDHAASSIVSRETFEHARESLLAALRRTRKLREREVSEMELGLRNAARSEEYRQSGDLLLANRSQIVRGQSSVSVPDYYALALPDGTQSLRTITLDPTLTVSENAERLYKRSRKAEASAAMLQERQASAQADAARLAQAEQSAARAISPEEITALRVSLAPALTGGGSQSGADSGPRQAPPDFEGHKIKRYQTVDGWEILVGENAAANDYLTTRIAASSDIWLHVRAAASAHGIIRAKNKPASVSQAALQQAAEMVAARSEVKHSSLIPVDYMLKKYVRKPRKSAPGAVTYQNEKTLFVAGIHGE